MDLPVGQVHHLQLSLKAKWRIPLILLKVSKSLPLRESDAKIWACFVHNKTNEELVESITTALAARVPSETRQVLRSAAHAVLLPQDCPFPTSTITRSGTSTPYTLSGGGTPTGSGREFTRLPSTFMPTSPWTGDTARSSPGGDAEQLYLDTGAVATTTAIYAGQVSPTCYTGLRTLTPLTLSRTGSGGQASPSGSAHHGSPHQLSRELAQIRTGSGGQASPNGSVYPGFPHQLSRDGSASAYGLPAMGAYQGTAPTRVVRDCSWGGGRGFSDWAARQLQQLYRRGGSPRARVVPTAGTTSTVEKDQPWNA